MEVAFCRACPCQTSHPTAYIVDSCLFDIKRLPGHRRPRPVVDTLGSNASDTLPCT